MGAPGLVGWRVFVTLPDVSAIPEPGTGAMFDSGPRVVCRTPFEEFCVLASGEIVCPRHLRGEPGAFRVIGNVHRDRIADVFSGRLLRRLRSWQLAAVASVASVASPRDVDEIRTVKALRLAVLPLSVMLDVVGQLPALEKLVLEGSGEPFLHGDVIPFLREVRRRRPDVAIQVGTSGRALDPSKCDTIAAERLADRIVFTIDGGREESYRRAGAEGSFWGALRALEDLVSARKRHGAGGRIEIRWEYLLESGNDSAAETDVARRLAAGIGVPIDFVSPDFEGASLRGGNGQPDAAGTQGGRRESTASRASRERAPWWSRWLRSSFRSGSALLPHL